MAGVLTSTAAQNRSSETLRRVLSVSVASVGVLLTAPLMAMIAIGIKLTSPGPVFFMQTRVGMDRRSGTRRTARPAVRDGRRDSDAGGKPFTIYKFRTMVSNGHGSNGGDQVWATPDDPRVTPIGRLLRLYRLDELPQLLNVIRGDMDVVGPRPEQPAIFARLRTQIDRYQERQQVRPGITGWAQINQRYDTCVDDVRSKVRHDLDYIARRSFFEDLKIMVRTLPVLIGKRGAW